MSEAVKVAQLYTEFNTKGLKETQSSLLGVKSSLTSIKGLLATVVGGFTVKKLATDFINAAKTAENYRTSIRAVSASIKDADAAYDRIRSWAEVNPVDTDEAIGAFVKLKTAAVDNCEDALTAVADLSTVMQRDMRDISDAVVSARAISLRQLGILLDQTGKKAVIESNGIRKEVEKDIASVRRGIIEVMREAYGGSMNKARDTYQGIIDTMGGMWTGFKQKVMEGANGPFETLKNKVMSVRDEWEKFTKSSDYEILASNLQSVLVGAIESVSTAIGVLTSGLKQAYQHADLLVGALAALATYKGVVAMLTALKAAPAVIAGLVSGPAGWVALTASLLAGVYAYGKTTDAMKENEKQIHRQTQAAEKLSKVYKDATKEQLDAAVREHDSAILDYSKLIDQLNREAYRLDQSLANSTSMEIPEAVKNRLTAIKEEIIKINDEMKQLGVNRDYLKGLLDSLDVPAVSSSKGNIPSSSATSNGKSAAEKLVEGIRDQIKYMGADANNFLPTLDKWLAKLKPLSEDWKKVKDLVNDIYGISIQDDATKADYILDKIEREKQAEQERVEMMKNANSEYLSDLAWRNSQALLTDEDYFSQTKALWEETKAHLEAQGLDMSNLFNWTSEAKEAFAALQDSAMNVARPALEELKRLLDDKKITLQQYIDKVRELIEVYGDMPLVVKEAGEAIKTTTEDAQNGIINLNDLTKQWIQDFQSGIADAIVDGEGFADTLTNIGKEIEKMILKLLLFGSDGQSGWLGGIGKWILSALVRHTGGIVGADAPTFTRQIKLPKFHTGGIVGMGEELAVLKKGEGVFTREQMKALGNMGGVGKVEVNVSVQNSGNGNMSEKQAEELGRSIREVVKAEVTSTMYDYARSGILRTA